MYHRYSTALSHLVLAGVALTCLKSATRHGFNLSLISYGIISLHSLLGIFKWGNPVHGQKVDRIYSRSRLLQTLLTLPCITAQLWSDGGYGKLAYTHPAVTLMLIFLPRKQRQGLTDTTILLNVLSCVIISLLTDNYFGVSTAVAYSINHFVLKEEGEVKDMPSVDFYNYALCFFSLFSLCALQN